MSHNFKNLKAHILPLSEASSFHVAKSEWKLVDVELHDEWDNCPCGKEIKGDGNKSVADEILPPPIPPAS